MDDEVREESPELPNREEWIQQEQVIRAERDLRGNDALRPPIDEYVTLRSITVAEVYLGTAIDHLTTKLSQFEGSNLESIANQISEARERYEWARGSFDWGPSNPDLFQSDARNPFDTGELNLPPGVTSIHGEYDVLGRNLVAMVFTFVLDEDNSARINSVLFEDTPSKFEVHDGKISYGLVIGAKRERVREVRRDLGNNLRSWIKDHFAGTLSSASLGLGPPTCALISLKAGKPGASSGSYLSVLGFDAVSIVERFAIPESVFVVYPIDLDPDNRMMGAFNEGDALAEGWVGNLSETPSAFHELISSSFILDAVRSLLYQLELRFRSVRDAHNRLDLERLTGEEIYSLRTNLLMVSRDLSTTNTDVQRLLSGNSDVWSNFSAMVPLTTRNTVASPDMKRSALQAMLDNLIAEDSNLHDLVMATSSVFSDSRDMELQAGVFQQTQNLKKLTFVLVVLTIALLFFGVATFLEQWFHVPVVRLQTPHVHDLPYWMRRPPRFRWFLTGEPWR